MNGKRILLVASGGGHWVELKRLSAAFEGFDSLYASTLPYEKAPSGSRPVATLRDGSRSSPASLAVMFLQVLLLLVRFRPDFVVTTGAAPGVFAIRIGRLIGAKTIWIDSIANAEELSLSGRLVGKYVDLWLTQWPHLMEMHPQLQFFGAVI
jgi:UDP-N-acetylglucosamine:LPS N-acetylglucosamine transferase